MVAVKTVMSALVKYPLTQKRPLAQKYWNLLKITNLLASVESEHDMKIYYERVQLLEKNLENWQLLLLLLLFKSFIYSRIKP